MFGLFSRRKRDEPQHLSAGRWGEEVAERHLRGEGWRILGRRVKVGRRDELDLIAMAGEVLVFVEVKTRRSEEFGRPFSAVNRGKRLHLARAARRYLERLPEKPAYYRFDVVEVVGEPGGGPPKVRHIERAFGMPAWYREAW